MGLLSKAKCSMVEAIERGEGSVPHSLCIGLRLSASRAVCAKSLDEKHIFCAGVAQPSAALPLERTLLC